jgi:hypothetical protein
MSKMIRVLLVIFFLSGFVAVGMNGSAWADKLKTGVAPQVASGQGNELARLEGTVITTPPDVETIKPGTFTVGSIATWTLNSVLEDNVYRAFIMTEQDLPDIRPRILWTSPIKLSVAFGSTLGVEQRVCFPVPPGKNGAALYWDGKAWIKIENAQNGQACVTIPASAPNPTYAIFVK